MRTLRLRLPLMVSLLIVAVLAQSAVATAFLTKPLDIQGVLDLIDGVLGDKTKIR